MAHILKIATCNANGLFNHTGELLIFFNEENKQHKGAPLFKELVPKFSNFAKQLLELESKNDEKQIASWMRLQMPIPLFRFTHLLDCWPNENIRINFVTKEINNVKQNRQQLWPLQHLQTKIISIMICPRTSSQSPSFLQSWYYHLFVNAAIPSNPIYLFWDEMRY